MSKFIAALTLLLAVAMASCSTVPADKSLSAKTCIPISEFSDDALLIIGEMHGTKETPALVARHVCGLAAAGHNVVLGLEIPNEEQPRLDKFMSSSGTPSDRADLITAAFWQRTNQDGRSSTAMVELIDQARALKQSGAGVRLIAIDKPTGKGSSDAAMADAIRVGISPDRNSRFVVLMGNYHAGKAPGSPSDPSSKSAALLLSDLSPTTVLVASRSGSAWLCMETCGIKLHNSTWAGERAPGFHSNDSPLPGYDGTYLLESISASPPAHTQPQ